MYNAKIIADSISETGKRLTTFEITFPRIVLAEFNMHRMLSRNSASSRAIPFKKQIQRIVDAPFIPERFPIDGKGMQPSSYIDKDSNPTMYNIIVNDWLEKRNIVLDTACDMYISPSTLLEWDWQTDDKPNIAIHKQLVNRLLEPFMWHTVIATATEWDNFLKLRTNEQAQFEIRRIADLMYEAYHAWDDYELDSILLNLKSVQPAYEGQWEAVKPKELKVGEWHLPFVSDEDFLLARNWINNEVSIKGTVLDNLKKVSVARCARVSYLTHDGKRDIEKDLELFEKLRTSGHYSPFEHVASPSFEDNGSQFVGSYNEEFANERKFHSERYMNKRNGNFFGWRQMRQDLPNENCEYFRKENK